MPAHLKDLVEVVSQKTERRRTFLEYAVDRYQYLELKGMGVTDQVALKLPLLDLYVPLKARTALPPGETPDRADPRLAGRKLTQEEAKEIGDRLGRPCSVVELLREHDGVIVVGDPGAGKTTLLKYLVLKCAGEDGGTEMGLGRRLPILVPLSAYATALEERDMRLDDFIVSYYWDVGLNVPTRELVDAALDRGDALMLLDGLDEVRQVGQRGFVVKRVVDFFAAHRRRGNKFVITSRIVGYREVQPSATGLVECTLLDFDDEDIARFVEHWTRTIEPAARGATKVAAQEAAEQQRELMAAIDGKPGVRALAANPLLLTILALMKRQGMVLPDRRAELYKNYVETLLKHWAWARALGRPPEREMDVTATLEVLGPVALWMQRTSPRRGLVQHGRLLRRVEGVYKGLGDEDPGRAAEQFLDDLRSHAGILVERGAGQYGFVHLTFQEYLAAVGLAQKAQESTSRVANILMKHVHESEWREVALLTVAHLGIVQGRPKAAGALVDALIQRAPGKPGHAAAVMGEAVADAPGAVPRKCRDGLIQRLLEMMRDHTHGVAPKERAACGDALARLGDPRFHTADAWFLPKDDMLGFVAVPEGRFTMGSDRQTDRDTFDHEVPVHELSLPAYYMSRWPVTVAQFRAFVEDAKFAVGDRNCLRGIANDPVVDASWREALGYCRWLTKRLKGWKDAPEVVKHHLQAGWSVTLPSEAEWERAARGPKGRRYPWGDRFDPNLANCAETEIGQTTAVGCFPGGATPEGIEELAGNVEEWTRSKYERYPYRCDGGREDLGGAEPRVVRGRAFYSNRWSVRSACRFSYDPDARDDYLGFRVVLSPFRS